MIILCLLSRGSGVRIPPGAPFSLRSNPDAWVTECSGHMGNTFGLLGSSAINNLFCFEWILVMLLGRVPLCIYFEFYPSAVQEIVMTFFASKTAEWTQQKNG